MIWLPAAREDIGYFKVFELQAAEVKELTLPEALSAYEVDIPSDQLSDLKPLLAAHAREWFDRPRSAWKELTPGTAKGTLVDDDRILEVLATPDMTFYDLKVDNRFGVFARRIAEDIGLPGPKDDDPQGWRVQAVAALLCTDAAAKCPENPPGEERIVPPGPTRDRALKLLTRWQRQIDLLDSFEDLATKADGTTSLQYWAKNLEGANPPLSSPIAETTLFSAEVERLAALDTFEEPPLAKHEAL